MKKEIKVAIPKGYLFRRVPGGSPYASKEGYKKRITFTCPKCKTEI